MSLNLELSSCVRASAIASGCTKCIDICPTKAIEFAPHLPAFTPEMCVECGGCVGVCPTSAFSLSNFSAINFSFSHFESPTVLSCKTNVPCLSVFSAEELVSLALGSEQQLNLDIGHCSSCEISSTLHPQIMHNIQEANFILSTFCTKQIVTVEPKIEIDDKHIDTSNRRDFLNLLKPESLAKQKAMFDEQVAADDLKMFEFDENTISKIKNKNIPDKRKLLFAILKREPKPQNYETIDSVDISFTSQKYIDEKCTNCQMCHRICPTGALGSVSNFSQINFDSMLCAKCHLCHDVCEYDAIHIQPTFELKEFFEPSQRLLAKFDIKRCVECGNQFTCKSDEITCQRCQTEEDEAALLHQNARKLEESK